MNILNYNHGDNLNKSVEILRQGKLIVYPTDTIYGIAANINNTQAIKNVYYTKKRSFDKPISICFHNIEQLENYVVLTDKINKILKLTLPGPYTYLLNKKDNVNPLLTANSSIVGVRIPDNIVSHELTINFPITSTSANISDFPTPNNITEIKKHLGNNIELYIDAGSLNNNQPSTILDLTGERPEIVRKGVCDEILLKKILKINL